MLSREELEKCCKFVGGWLFYDTDYNWWTLNHKGESLVLNMPLNDRDKIIYRDFLQLVIEAINNKTSWTINQRSNDIYTSDNKEIYMEFRHKGNNLTEIKEKAISYILRKM